MYTGARLFIAIPLQLLGLLTNLSRMAHFGNSYLHIRVSSVFYLVQLRTSRHLYTFLCVATLTRPSDESSASMKTRFFFFVTPLSSK